MQGNITTKEDIVSQLEKLADAEEVLKLKGEFRILLSSFGELTRAERDIQERAFYNKEEKEEDEKFEFIANPIDVRFVELKNIFTEKLDKAKAKKKKEEKENFDTKKELLVALTNLVENGMQNPGSAFQQFYEIRDKWDATGEVNKANFKELQSEYSLYRDKFYYNVDIFNELKSYDFKKNGEQKQNVIAELNALLEQNSIKKMEREVKELQSKWDTIGPTSNEQWENLKNNYWNGVNNIYEKIKEHYQAIRNKQALAFEEKTSLLGQMEALKNELESYEKPQQWSDVSSIVNELHNKWKATDFSGKSKEDGLWEQFSTHTEAIRSKANEYFGKLKDENSRVEEAKEKLIKKVEELQNSTDWRNTTQNIVKLQKEWKTVGQTQYKKDQELWERFRAACNSFFNAKKHYFDTKDEREADNFTLKSELSKKIGESKNVEELKLLIQEWQTVGFVPKKDIKNVDNTFNNAVQNAAKKLNIAKNEMQNLRFVAKVEAIKEDENATEKLKAEKRYVQGQIDKLKEELIRYQENMGFFGNSKGSLKLKEIVEKKVETTEIELKNWQQKLGLLK